MIARIPIVTLYAIAWRGWSKLPILPLHLTHSSCARGCSFAWQNVRSSTSIVTEGLTLSETSRELGHVVVGGNSTRGSGWVKGAQRIEDGNNKRPGVNWENGEETVDNCSVRAEKRIVIDISSCGFSLVSWYIARTTSILWLPWLCRSDWKSHRHKLA
jgi:hypothetical protein